MKSISLYRRVFPSNKIYKLRILFKTFKITCHLILALMAINAVQVARGNRVVRDAIQLIIF